VMRRRGRRLGYSTMEVLVASFLALGLGSAIATTLVSTSRAARETVEDTREQTENRAITDIFSQFLRSAKPLGRCLDETPSSPRVEAFEPNSTTQNACKVVGEEEHPFAAANGSSLSFYAYTNAATSLTATDSEGFAPDLVTVAVGATPVDCGGEPCYEMTVTLRCNGTELDGAVCAAPSTSRGSLSYTDAAAADVLPTNPARLVRTILVRNPAPFSFLDVTGEKLATAGTTGAPSNLAAVAVVRVRPEPAATDGPSVQPLLIPLPSKGFRG
jgi:hypothetical protein